MSRIGFAGLIAALHLGSCIAQVPFFAPQIEDDGRRYFAAADMDGDGDIDLVGVTNPLANVLGVWSNDGGGRMALALTVPLPGPLAGNMAAGDFNGDGLDDVVVSVDQPNGGNPRLVVYPGPLSGGLGPPVIISTAAPVARLLSGDANGDGTPEFLAFSRTSTAFSTIDQARWFIAAGGTWVPSPPAAVSAGDPIDIVAADFDGDGILDCAVRTFGAGATMTLNLYYTISGALQPGPAIPLTYSSAMSFAAGDADADGDADLFLWIPDLSSIAAQIQVVYQTSLGQWNPGPLQATTSQYGSGQGELFAVDWDGDGLDDLFLRPRYPGSPYPGHYHFFHNGSAGAFVRAFTLPLGRSLTLGPGFADLTNDGTPDFIGPAEILFSDGVIAPDLSFTQGPLLAFDVEGDGDPDIVRTDSFYVWENDGTGQTVSLQVSPVITPPMLGAGLSIGFDVVADLDNDGLLDAIGRQLNYGTFAGHRSLWGLPGGRLLDLGPALTNPGQQLDFTFQRVTDFNGDGASDIIINAGILMAQATFGLYGFVANTWQGFELRDAADANGDGRADVLVTQSATGITGILMNAGAGGLLGIYQSDPGMIASSARLSDVDDDGFSDILYLRQGAAGVEVGIIRHVAGSLVPPVAQGGLASGANRVAAVDLDASGTTDVIAWSSDGQRSIADVFLRTGAGLSILPPLRLVLSDLSLFADADGDGDVEAIGARGSRGTRFDGTPAGRRRQYGSSTLGSGFIPPILGVTGPLRSGLTATLRGRGYLGGAPAVVSIGLQESVIPNFPLPGITAWNYPWVAAFFFPATGGPAAIPGRGLLDLTFSVPPGLLGQQVFVQAGFGDPLAPQGIVVTNGLEIRFGQ